AWWGRRRSRRGASQSAGAIRPTRTAVPPRGCPTCARRSLCRCRGPASSQEPRLEKEQRQQHAEEPERRPQRIEQRPVRGREDQDAAQHRSEDHTSELQSRFDLVCRLLLEKKKKN